MVTRERLREVEREARRLLHAAKIDSPPVDPAVVARRLGISIQRTDLGPGCAGVLVRKGEAAVIGVHWAHHPNRQRFTIAHELGHYCLHEGGRYVDEDLTIQYRSDEPNGAEEEREAHHFAGALLMPRGWLKEAFLQQPFRAGDDHALAELAKRFQVSPQAMSIRLTKLGLLL